MLNLTFTTTLGVDTHRHHTEGKCQQGQKKQLYPCHGEAEQTFIDKTSRYPYIYSNLLL